MKKIITTLLGAAAIAQADTVVTAHGTVSGEDDADQAAPMLGMSITPNVGVSPKGNYKKLFLKSMSFQTSSSGTSRVDENVAYLQVYDAFAVDASGKVSAVGNLVASSTNAHRIGSSSDLNKTLTWNFDGQVALDGNKTYSFVFSTESSKAITLSDHGHLVAGGFELNSGDPYSGGDGFLGNAATKGWDLEFRVEFSGTPQRVVPPAAVIGLGEFNFLLRDTSE